MKNTLAENMLRFGVKNLSDSNIKKIEEALLLEEAKPWQPFKSVNPKSWTIKAESQEIAQKLASNMTLSVGNLNTAEAIKGTYGMWCIEPVPNAGIGGSQQYQVRQDARTALQHAASDLLLTMAVNGVYNASVYKDYVTTVKAANVVVSKLFGAHLSQMTNPWQLGQTKGWQTNSYNKADNMKQSSWEAILPLIKIGIDKFIATYVVTPVAASPQAAAPNTTAPKMGN